jgi:hypothetical protein
MSIQLQMEQRPGYLAARFIGAGVVEEVWRQFESVAEHCKRTKNDKLLVDVRGAEANISLIDRFQIAEESQIFKRYGLKIATVDNPWQRDPQRFGEMVARTRGVNVRAFSDFHAAEEWLLK